MRCRGIRSHRRGRIRNSLRHLRKDISGIAVIELAICLPPLIFMGMYGLELVNLATANMQISQIALSLADNASRLGQTDNSGVIPTINESEIDSVMTGAVKQGAPMDLVDKGKIILSSLEVDSRTGKQFIHWQRCRGSLNRASAYGNDTDANGLSGAPIAGLGGGAQPITAKSGSAVMFVEVYYNYERLFGDFFIKSNKILSREAAYVIRDDRDLRDSDEEGVTGTRSDDDTCA
jgi:Flp pilus assembly protein TadG